MKFVPPKIVKEEVNEDPPKQDDLKKAPIGNADTKGDIEYTPPPKQVEVITPPPKQEPFEIVDEWPTFPGGYETWLAKHIDYPADALEMGVQGTVYLKVVIDETGKVGEVTVIKGIAGLTDEAVKKVKMMPAWQPAKVNGHAVPVRMMLPIKFKPNTQ
jgi:protein TonB